MPLTPNNRNEAWMKGMVDGSTTLEPNNRKEHWYKEIVDAIGSGGGGGVGGVLIVNAALDIGTLTATLNKTWKEINDAFVAGTNVIITMTDGANFYKYMLEVVINGSGSYSIQAADVTYSTDNENGYPVSEIG